MVQLLKKALAALRVGLFEENQKGSEVLARRTVLFLKCDIERIHWALGRIWIYTKDATFAPGGLFFLSRAETCTCTFIYFHCVLCSETRRRDE